jgi:hypothetical protein
LERVGIDVAEFYANRDVALQYWLSNDERTLLASGGGLSPTHLWAAKEAAFKTLPAGEPFAPRQIWISCSAANVDAMKWRYAASARSYRGTIETFQHQRCIVAVARRTARAARRRRETTFA